MWARPRVWNQLVDLLVIGKPDLSFSRMHVDIDPLGLDIKKEHKQRSMALREKRTVAIHNRMLHGAVFDRPAIDEEFLRRPPGARPHRIDDEAPQGQTVLLNIDGQRPVTECGAIHLQHTIARRGHGRQCEDLIAVMNQPHVYLRRR